MCDGRELFPLSLSQQNIWDLERAYPGTSINAISTTVRIKGRVDYAMLNEALNLALKHDCSLRARLTTTDGGVMQYHAPYEREQFPLLDFSMTDNKGISHWAVTLTREAMPLLNAPLYRFIILRINENTAGILIKTHHIISDGWTQMQLCNRIGRVYLDLLAGAEPSVEDAPSYALHVEEEQRYLGSTHYERDREFWRAQLESATEPAALKSVHSPIVSPVGRRRAFELSETLNQAVYSFCRAKRIAPFAVFYMALAIYLRRTGCENGFAIGVPILGRVNYTAKQTSGMYVSTIPLIGEVDAGWDLERFCDELTGKWLDVLKHQSFPFRHITELAGGVGPLYHIVLSYQDSTIITDDETSLCFSGSWHYSGYQAEHLCIHITNVEDNRRYRVDYDYLTQVFSDSEIEDLHNYLCRVLSAALAEPERAVGSLPLLGEYEREKVLYTFNRTDRPLRGKSLYDAFLRSVERNPKRVAVISGGVRTTYEQLQREGERFAAALPNEGELIALLLPRGLALLSAMVGAMRAECAWLIISPELPEGRIRAILEDSGAARVVTEPEYVKLLGGAGLPLIFAGDPGRAGERERRRLADPLAYVVYTSGTTGRPKGVEITARNLLNFSQAMERLYSSGAVLSSSNIGFDVFVMESAAALLCSQTILLPEERELEDPSALAELISNYRVGFLTMTPSRLTELMKHPAFRFSLRNIESVICGGETFPGELLQRLRGLTDARIFNQYGPSETTVAVSYQELTDADHVNIGKPMENCRFYVLDDGREPLPVGVYGELWIGGASVGRGYRNAPELTAERFLPDPFEFGGRMYRSGDMACWTPEGEISLAGRRDRQVKLRGLRVEPQEISGCLASCPGVADAAVKIWETGGQSVIVGYYASPERLSETELLTRLADYLPYYMVPACLIHMTKLPLTPSGKVDEKLLPEPELDVSAGLPVSRSQEEILEVFRRVLGRADINADSDYFLCGGTSLNAMETLGLLEQSFGVRLRVSALHACRTARRLGDHLSGDEAVAAQERITRAAEREFWPLSPMQRDIYFESFTDPTGLAYNMPGAFRFASRPDAEKLRAAFTKLIAADDILRTRFVREGREVVQRITGPAEFELPVVTARTLEEAFGSFLRPFDLENGPLLRAALWRGGEDEWALLIDMHHLIADGLSTPLLLSRLDGLYGGGELTLPLTFRDYACYLSGRETEPEYAEFWRAALAELPEPMELPTDRPRPAVFDFHGGRVATEMTPSLAQSCEAFCEKRKLTPFMLFSGAFGILLSKLTGRGDLILGTPVSARARAELTEMCGPLIGTLPLRLRPAGGTEDYFESVRGATVGMLDHADMTAGDLVSLLDLPRTLGGNSLYRAMFSLRPLDDGSFTFAGEPLVPAHIGVGAAKLELSLEAVPRGGSYAFELEYAAGLFERETAELWLRCYCALLAEITSGAEDIASMTALAPADRLRYFDRPNRVVYPYLDMPVHRQISDEALLSPEKPAVIWHGETVSFGELDARAAEIAGLLASRGVKRGDAVGLCCGRTPDMLAALLGILRVGAAYVPFLPSYPAGRISYMLENSRAAAVLCDAESAAAIPENAPCLALSLSEKSEPLYEAAPVEGADAMYILYTSGSTGKPKGVRLPHRALCNLLESVRELMSPHAGPVLCSTNMTFDIFITETLLPLAQGLTVVLADEEELLLPWRLAELIETRRTTVTQFTPSRLQMLLGNAAFARAASEIEFVILVGEAVTPKLVADFKAASAGRFINMYGPTEAAVYVTQGELSAGEPVTIGAPLRNCRVYVLDGSLRPALPTAVGELYLAGECLADGYVGREDLTEQAFLPDPFFPGRRMYRSGDMGRLRADSGLECLGRVDSQVKINGNRVELGEITGAMLTCGAKQAVALAEKTPDGADTVVGVASPRDIDAAALRARLAELLPPHMIPSRFLLLDEIPSNASGKADLPAIRKLLAETPEAAPDAGPAASQAGGDMEELVLSVWRACLGKSAIDPDASFFEQGGTSLGALGVISEYFNRGLVMDLSQFYKAPTVRAQAELLHNTGSAAEPAPAKSEYPAHVPEALPISGSAPDTVLLTGATGFLGAHLLRSLMDRGTGRILCLLRDGDAGRLSLTLGRYFGGVWAATHMPFIGVLKGDVTLPMLGLDGDTFAAVAERTDAVYHCAADVRHYASEAESEAANLTGTRNVIEFAERASAAMFHISTTSVAGDALIGRPNEKPVFTERDLDVGQNWRDNVYTRTKFLAENEVFVAAERGLPVRVFRVGRLVGRATDGAFQLNPETNAFWLLIRGLKSVKALPESMAGQPIDLTPVDVCADAIAALAGSCGSVAHIQQERPDSLREVASALIPELAVVPDGEFARLLSEAASDGRGELVAPLVNQLNGMRVSGGGGVEVSSAETHMRLREAGFVWPRAQVDRLLSAF